MVTKQSFINRMELLRVYEAYENQLDDLGIRIWERDEVSSLITEYVKMICEGFNSSADIDSALAYWMYELDWGLNPVGLDCEKGLLTTDYGALYDYLITLD